MDEDVKTEDELEETVPGEQLTDEGETQQTADAAAEDDQLKMILAKAEEYKEALQRERADFQNFRKRIERETESMKSTISSEVLARLLPVLDDFERALEAVPEEEKEKVWMEGIMLIRRKLQNMLEAEGIQLINPLGEPFYPNFHEAIGADEPSEGFESGYITAVLQKGYVKGERVLRPAIVRVAN